MKIPPFLDSLYSSNHRVSSFVTTTISKVAGHLTANRMVFFPEYTDHGITHLELTLQTAVDLATDPSRELITCHDAAVLTTSVGLHDLGMYLSRDGFESLISHNCQWRGIPFFDTTSWHTLWDVFYAEASRFDGRKLRLLFGNNYRPVRPLPLGGESWEDFDYLLVGEFLRRHHPRLAHEIALYGLPAKSGESIPICPIDSDEESFLADVSGLVARSHGMDLRTCLDYLETKYQNKINPRGIHVAFISVLLRISDYFQIQSARAPVERTVVTSFQSQLSEKEWRVHQSITDIHNTSSDPEAIVVNATPADVATYLRIKTWLSGLQYELDRSWAILGEIYGLQSHNKLNLLGLKIRRVKSNLDDEEAFASTVSYVPAHVLFKAANADLLTLLVGPLYNNDPSVAIRELFQNSVDAVREFNDASLRHPELAEVDRYQTDADVVLNIECDEQGQPATISIVDRGIGMTTEVVRNFFLTAGASFRKSSAWRGEFEDNSGHSRIFRTGRFGVGALAAFLLADEIEVTTRNAFEDQGIRFTARIDDEAISLERITCPAGTKISIQVPQNRRKRLSALLPGKYEEEIDFRSNIGHYFLKTPSLRRYISGKKDLPIEAYLPQFEDDFSSVWRCLNAQNLDKVFWTFDQTFPVLAVNGIVVKAPTYGANILWQYIVTPRISLFDRDGFLALNLQRTDIQGKYPFEPQLLESLSDDLLAHAFVDAPVKCDSNWFHGRYEGFQESDWSSYKTKGWARWVITRTGFFPLEPKLLSASEAKHLIVAIGGEEGCQPWGETLRSLIPMNTIISQYMAGAFAPGNRNIKGVFRRGILGFEVPIGAGYWPCTSYVPKELIGRIEKLNPGKELSHLIEALQGAPSHGDWIVKSFDGEEHPEITEAIAKLRYSKSSPTVFCVLDVGDWDLKDSVEAFASRWLEVLHGSTVPFDAASRLKLEGEAKTMIAPFLKARRDRQAAAKSRSKVVEDDDDDG